MDYFLINKLFLFIPVLITEPCQVTVGDENIYSVKCNHNTSDENDIGCCVIKVKESKDFVAIMYPLHSPIHYFVFWHQNL